MVNYGNMNGGYATTSLASEACDAPATASNTICECFAVLSEATAVVDNLMGRVGISEPKADQKGNPMPMDICAQLEIFRSGLRDLNYNIARVRDRIG